MSLKIIFDSSTLILITKSSLLDIFIDYFPGEIVIPEAVQEECSVKSTPDAQIITHRVHEKKIRVLKVRDKKLVNKLMEDLNINLGEAEAIILGKEFKSMVATDDWNAIQSCKILKIPFVSSLSVLVKLKEIGVISKTLAVVKLTALIEFGRYHEEIIKQVRSKLEE